MQVESLAQVGVQLLLFTLGLEFSLQKLKAVRNVALIGLLSAAVGLASEEHNTEKLWISLQNPEAVQPCTPTLMSVALSLHILHILVSITVIGFPVHRTLCGNGQYVSYKHNLLGTDQTCQQPGMSRL